MWCSVPVDRPRPDIEASAGPASAPTTSRVAVEIRLLGPVELHVNGTRAAAGGPRQRMLLALLCLAEGRLVPAETLMERLWDDTTAPRSSKTLHVHISNLRHALQPYSDRLQSAAGGYRIDVTRCVIDATQLAPALRRARADLATGDDASAVRRLHGAVDLWRGELCADIRDHPALLAPRAHYAQLRLDALELLFSALLRAGTPSVETLGRIEAAVAEAPLRETFWAQLMLALYARGRQRDALAAFQRARSVLSEEAGLDPGPALRRLQQRILLQADEVGEAVEDHSALLPTVVWVEGSGRPRSRALEPGRPLLVGRSRSCDITIDADPRVSRRHVEIEAVGRRVRIRDLGSHNGSAVDGEPVLGEADLVAGGVLQVGDSVLFVRPPRQRTDSRQQTVTGHAALFPTDLKEA
jgi:SARP family transcriptional regulator, regulator of embCAB operon